MSSALTLAALTMGLVGGSHCAAMCAPLCPGVVSRRDALGKQRVDWTWIQFHAARMLAYALLGALMAASTQALGWLSAHVGASNRLWMLVPVLSLSWGLVMLVFGRQPIWAQRQLQRAWASLSRLTAGRPWLAGLAWAFMPCGLLYSALALAALGSSPAQGALLMLLFAAGTTVWIAVAQHLWGNLRQWRGMWGMRLSGLALVVGAALVLSGVLVPDAAMCGPDWR
jgi:uncharacterized protein